jgi:hypothetical protein
VLSRSNTQSLIWCAGKPDGDLVSGDIFGSAFQE